MTQRSLSPIFFAPYQDRINHYLSAAIDKYTEKGSTLSSAMRYSTLLGGKRIRPILTLATANVFNASSEDALIPAGAIELIHAYSLIHDDLPSMDDDDLRRGQATCHKKFDEATAILAGDALQSLAFEILSKKSNIPDHHKVIMIQILSTSSGARGMVLGQAIDFDSVGQTLTLQQLEYMHQNKTGALIEASILMGAFCSPGDISAKEQSALKDYAAAIGLAFQVKDDILDVESDTETLGKMQGADIARNKPTYPALLGLDGAKIKLANLHDSALESLVKLPQKDTQQLAEISHFIIKRKQ